MAKSTHAQEVATGTSDSYTEHELTDPDIVVHREMLGGDPALAGTDSSQSSEKEQKSEELPNQTHPSPVPETDNPLKDTDKPERSTVDTADGSGQKMGRPQSGKKGTVRSRTVRSHATDEFD